ASRLISPRVTRSRRSINSLWCGAGSYPQCRHHSMRLLRTRRRFSNISATTAGETSNVPNSGAAIDRSYAKLGLVISCRSENVHQFLVTHFIRVPVEFLVGCLSGRACSGVLDVLHEFEEGALGSDVALHSAIWLRMTACSAGILVTASPSRTVST